VYVRREALALYYEHDPDVEKIRFPLLPTYYLVELAHAPRIPAEPETLGILVGMQ
jgi:hypothetical protein